MEIWRKAPVEIIYLVVAYCRFPEELLHTLKKKSEVYCVAILPHTSNNNATRIVSGNEDNTLRIWNVDSGECLQVLNGHSNSVTCVAIMPDGRIVSGSFDETLRIWNAGKWGKKCLQVLNGHGSYVLCVAIMPDGRIVSGSSDNTLRVWNADTSKCLQVLKGHSNSVRSITLLQFKYHFVSGSEDNTLRVWNANGECKQILEDHSKVVFCVAVIHDPNRNTIVSGSYDNALRIWNPYSGECFQVIQGHSNWVNCVAIYLMVVLLTETLKIWEET